MRVSAEAIQKVRGLIIVVLPLTGFLVAIYLSWNRYVFPRDLLLLGLIFSVTNVGIGIGYHRMLTHTGFGAQSWLRGLLIILGCMAWEGAPVMWASTHIKHHAHSDEEHDPHTPLHGFWHAHVGWIFDRKNFADVKLYAPHLLEDRTVMMVDRFSWVWMTLALAIPFALGGWTGLLWGGVVRIFLTTHITWCVNSVCHTFGKRAFETTDESRNEWVIGLLAFGEGWHNNHHAFPRNAFHGMRWWQLDVNGLIIRGLEAVGLVWNVQRVAPEAEVAQRTRMQAMRQSVAGMRDSVLSSLAAMQSELARLSPTMIPNLPLTDAQWAQCEAFQRDAMLRLDAMMRAVATSTNLKRQKMLQYQKEAQKLLSEAKQKWAVVTGKAVTA